MTDAQPIGLRRMRFRAILAPFLAYARKTSVPLMVRLFKFVLIAIVAILLLAFAIANRQTVLVSFDPFASGDNPAIAIEAPLYVVLIVTAMLGVVAGGAATWFAQGKHRRAARQSRAEADKWRAEADRTRAQAVAAPGPPARR
ncbi:MAG: LapA family protein [Roseiarcus sp.]